MSPTAELYSEYRLAGLEKFAYFRVKTPKISQGGCAPLQPPRVPNPRPKMDPQSLHLKKTVSY